MRVDPLCLLWCHSTFEHSFWIVRASSLAPSFMVFSIGFLSLFSSNFFVFFADVSTRPGRSTNNSLAAMLKPTQPVSQPLLEVSSSSVACASSVPTPAVASTPVLLSQHDLTQAFSQALGESLPRLVAALQGHVHLSNSSVGENVSSATAAVSSSVVSSLVSLSARAS